MLRVTRFNESYVWHPTITDNMGERLGFKVVVHWVARSTCFQHEVEGTSFRNLKRKSLHKAVMLVGNEWVSLLSKLGLGAIVIQSTRLFFVAHACNLASHPIAARAPYDLTVASSTSTGRTSCSNGQRSDNLEGEVGCGTHFAMNRMFCRHPYQYDSICIIYYMYI